MAMRVLARVARLTLLAFPVALIPSVMPTGAAAACTHQVSLAVSPGSAAIGATATVTGGCFNTDPTVGPVDVRLDAGSGQQLWSGRPDSAGGFAFSFTTPSASGYHVILAFQADSFGYAMPGTPGRAPFQIVAPVVPTPAPATQAPNPVTQAPVASTAPVATVAPRPPVAATGPGAPRSVGAAPVGLPAAVPAEAPVSIPVAVPVVPGVGAPSTAAAVPPAPVPAANPVPSIGRPDTIAVPAAPSPWPDRLRIVAIAAVAVVACGFLLLVALVLRRRRTREASPAVPLVAWAEDVVSRVAAVPNSPAGTDETAADTATTAANTPGTR